MERNNTVSSRYSPDMNLSMGILRTVRKNIGKRYQGFDLHKRCTIINDYDSEGSDIPHVYAAVRTGLAMV
ncbi:MAG: hypothetical protein JXA07_07525 [Spirochaetes bacterium]|nr:hypothetical protein [Spirochaetota bacterium]